MDPPRKASSSLPLPGDTGSVAGLALGRMAPLALAMAAVVLWYVPWPPEVPARCSPGCGAIRARAMP